MSITIRTVLIVTVGSNVGVVKNGVMAVYMSCSFYGKLVHGSLGGVFKGKYGKCFVLY